MVQVGGIRVGRVQDVELDDGKVLVTFEVDHGVEFGNESQASVEVLNLLGEKYLDLIARRRRPARRGRRRSRSTAPQSAYDIVGVFGDLTTTTEQIDTDQLDQALERRLRHGQPVRARDPGQLRGHRPALAVGRLARRADPGACSQSSRERQQGAGRPQRRPRRPDAEQRPGLRGGASGARQAIHRLLVNARDARRSSCAASPPTTRSRSARRSREVDDLLGLLNSQGEGAQGDAATRSVPTPRSSATSSAPARGSTRTPSTWPRSRPASSCPGLPE